MSGKKSNGSGVEVRGNGANPGREKIPGFKKKTKTKNCEQKRNPDKTIGQPQIKNEPAGGKEEEEIFTKDTNPKGNLAKGGERAKRGHQERFEGSGETRAKKFREEINIRGRVANSFKHTRI